MNSSQENGIAIVDELSLHNTEMVRNIIDNYHWNQKLGFYYPGNGNLYNALTCQAFTKFVCSWIEAVQDYYILHFPSNNSSFKSF